MSYMADGCRLVTDAGVRLLRSYADTRTLVVGRTDTIRYDTIEEINVDSKAEYTA